MHLTRLRSLLGLDPMRAFGLFVEAEGSATQGAGGGAAGSGQAEVVPKAEFEKAQAELKALRDAEAKRQADAKKASEEAAAKNGEAAKLLEQKNAELEAAQKKAAELEAREKARADKLLAKLPDAAKKKLDLVRDSLPTSKFVELLELEVEGAGAQGDGEGEGGVPPFAGGRDVNARSGDKGKYKPHPKSVEILEERLGKDPALFDNLTTLREPDEHGTMRVKFSMPVRKVFEQLRPGQRTKLSKENAPDKRR